MTHANISAIFFEIFDLERYLVRSRFEGRVACQFYGHRILTISLAASRISWAICYSLSEREQMTDCLSG